jgi:energy-coupling factor transport system permease protein
VRSRYRPDRWRAAEWLTASCGLACLVAGLVAGAVDEGSLTTSMQPLAVPALPLVATVGVLLAALAALTSPPPPSTPRTRS